MMKHRLPSLSNHNVETAFDAATPGRAENLLQAEVPTNTNATDQTRAIDQSVEEYMQMAARMLYDIIREWRECHANEKSGNEQTKSERNPRR